MYVRLSKNSFIRVNNTLGYIVNQATRLDRRYNETGVDYLAVISRTPQDVELLVREKLLPLYANVSFEIVYEDFMEFIMDLAAYDFLVVGETVEDLEGKDVIYSYAKGNMHTRKSLFSQDIGEEVPLDTQISALQEAKTNPYLMSLQFEITNKCNERCIHCYIPNEEKNVGIKLPLEKFTKIVDEFAEMGGLQICLSGGEIFLHPDLIPMVEYCRDKDMQISLLTNLVSLRDNHVSAIKAANVALIQTSLYSMNAETHDRITTIRGSFDKTKSAIEKLVAADVPVKISCPMMKANKDDFHDVLQYAASLGIQVQTDFILMAEENGDTSNLAQRLSLEETEVVIKEIIENRGKSIEDAYSNDAAFVFDKRLFSNLPPCSAGVNNLCVSANGDVYPCTGWHGFTVGNLFRQSLKEIWIESEKLKRLRNITNSDFEKCQNCEAFEYCSLCMARNFNESNGDIFGIAQHFCDVAFLNKKIHDLYVSKESRN